MSLTCSHSLPRGVAGGVCTCFIRLSATRELLQKNIKSGMVTVPPLCLQNKFKKIM